MWSICLFAFIVCIIVKMIRSGEGLAILTQFVSFTNSLKEASPRRATETQGFLEIEYKFGRRIFCILIPKKKIQPWNNWFEVAGLKPNSNSEWVKITGEIYYYAGPFRNYHGFALCPKHISGEYQKLAFKYKNGGVIHVEFDEVITEKLKTMYEQYVTLAAEKAKKRTIKKEDGEGGE